MMRIVAVVGCIVAALLAVYLAAGLLGGDRTERPLGPPVEDAGRAADPDPPADARSARVPVVDPPAEARPDPGTAAKSEGPSDPAGELPAPGFGVIELEVVDRASREPVPGFRYVIYTPTDARIERDDLAVDGHLAEIELPFSSPRTVRVEADGFEPSSPIVLELAPGERRLRVPVALDRSARGAGVWLLVRRADTGEPVPRLEVGALARDIGSSAEFTLLWRRRSTDDAGEFPLPELPPGEYRLELQALDADGRPAALVPVVHELTWWGNQRIDERVSLQPGARVALTLVDAVSGDPLGPEVGLRLEDRLGEVIETRWIHRGEDGAVAGVDTLPVAARCELAAPLPPGSYRLLVQRGADGTARAHPVDLVAGRDAELKIAVDR